MKLSIKKLFKKYSNGVQALDGISLEISTGMFGLLGPNGAGKSTLMRTLATLQEADSGKVFLDDINVLKEKQRVKQVLGYLPQEFGVYPEITAKDLLNHIAVLKGIKDKKERNKVVSSLLHQTNLTDSGGKKLGSYSGGMLRRFGIAQALMGEPKIIIVDEPTAGLDPLERRRFHNFLSEIGENIIVILSTHIVEDVKELCSNMAIINAGKVLKTGEPKAEIDSLKGKIWERKILKPELTSYQKRFEVISSHLFSGELIVRVYCNSQPESSFNAVSPTLEDVYFTTIKHSQSLLQA